MTDERTDGGKWKIGQCSVGPETANEWESRDVRKKLTSRKTKVKKCKDPQILKCKNAKIKILVKQIDDRENV